MELQSLLVSRLPTNARPFDSTFDREFTAHSPSMSSRGARAEGTDGSDYRHRQKVAGNFQQSVNLKINLRILFGLHLLVLLVMWAKVGGEVLFNQLRVVEPPPAWWKRLDLPSAYPWEYVWSLSFIPIICALLSFPRNKIWLLRYHYYLQFCLGILPCAIGLGSQFPELIDYIMNRESSKTPTFNGAFPLVVLWYIFFIVAFQIHGFAMYFSSLLLQAWSPTSSTAKANKAD